MHIATKYGNSLQVSGLLDILGVCILQSQQPETQTIYILTLSADELIME